jgi:hypothetical protein
MSSDSSPKGFDMTIVRALEYTSIFVVVVSSILLVLGSRHGAGGGGSREVRFGAWGFAISGLLLGAAGGLDSQEAVLIFGGLVLLCLGIGIEPGVAEHA